MNLAAVSNLDVNINEDAPADDTVLSNNTTLSQMCKMPDFGPIFDHGSVINVSGWVDESCHPHMVANTDMPEFVTL